MTQGSLSFANRIPGVAYVICYAAAFSLMGAAVKSVGASLPSAEIVVFRGLFTLVITTLVVTARKQSLWGRQPRLLAIRGISGSLALICVFYATTKLPLAYSTVLQYLHPAFSAIMAPFLLGERFSGRALIALLLSFLGVLAIANPDVLHSDTITQATDELALFAGVAGAFGSSLVYIFLRKIGPSEDPWVVIFHFSVWTIPIALPFAVADWVWPAMDLWWGLLAVGVFTQLGQICLTMGLVRMELSRAAVYSHAQIVFAAILSVLMFNDSLQSSFFIGGGLIVSASLLMARKSRQ